MASPRGEEISRKKQCILHNIFDNKTQKLYRVVLGLTIVRFVVFFVKIFEIFNLLFERTLPCQYGLFELENKGVLIYFFMEINFKILMNIDYINIANIVHESYN